MGTPERGAGDIVRLSAYLIEAWAVGSPVDRARVWVSAGTDHDCRLAQAASFLAARLGEALVASGDLDGLLGKWRQVAH